MRTNRAQSAWAAMLGLPVYDKPNDQGGGDGGEGEGEGEGEGGEGEQPKPEPKPEAKPGLGDKLKGSLLEREKPADDKTPKQEAPKPGADGRPADVPEKFWDATTKTIKAGDLAKAYSALETSHGTLKRSKGIGDDVPADAAEYFADGLELDKEVDRLGVLPDDPGLKAWGEVAHKYSIGKAAAISIAKEMFKSMNGHAPAPIDPEQERQALGPNYKAVTEGVFVWIEGLDREGKLGDADADIVLGLAKTANGIKFLNKMRQMSGERAIPLDTPGGGSSEMSPEEWQSNMMAAVKAKDYKEQARLDELGKSIFGEEKSSGSPLRGVREGR